MYININMYIYIHIYVWYTSDTLYSSLLPPLFPGVGVLNPPPPCGLPLLLFVDIVVPGLAVLHPWMLGNLSLFD